MDILRFITAGNVDDGKSTLIGRLLYDTHNVKQDALQGELNLAHITDGLRAEREQGITIDVAYKYYTTAARKYIITDAPGHVQFTRNLVTGASNADAMIILIDARHGITEQTRRHMLVAFFLQIPRVAVAVNKMDLLNYDEAVFQNLVREFTKAAAKLQLPEVTFIPISALRGDNVSFSSPVMSWYSGATIEQFLELARPRYQQNDLLRCLVQYKLNAIEHAYCCKMLSGAMSPGCDLQVFPDSTSLSIQRMTRGYEETDVAVAGDNIVVYTSTPLFRGDIIATSKNAPSTGRQLRVLMCWLDGSGPMVPGARYVVRINARETQCTIAVLSLLDIHSFEEKEGIGGELSVNDLGYAVIETADIVCWDVFEDIAENGRGIVIDTVTNNTVGAFVVKRS